MIEVVTFTSTLTDAREYGQTAVLLGDIVDELEHVHGLAHAGATEETDLTALGERHEQIDNFDARDEQIAATGLFVVRRRGAVDRPVLFRGNGAAVVLRRTEHVHDATERRLTDRHRDRCARRFDGEAALQAFGGSHRDGANDAITELLLHLEREIDVLELQCLVDLRDRFTRKFHVDDRADDLSNLAGCHVGTLCLVFVFESRNQTAAAPPTISANSLVIAA